jgi:hypothetical protein
MGGKLLSLVLVALGSAALPYSVSAEALTDGLTHITETPVMAAATSTISEVVGTTSAEENAHPTASDSVRGMLIAEDHRIIVVAFVESLMYVANKNNNAWSAEIRKIAEIQANAVATTTEAIQQTGARNGVKRLLFGNDYRHIAALKRQIVQTEEHLERLKAILANTTNATDRAVLATQLERVEKDQAKISDFVSSHEKATGFLGWFAKLMVRSDSLANNS